MATKTARRCSSGKARYRDRVAALVALADTTRATSASRNELRAYFCPDCRGWHLTSWGKRRYRGW